MNLSSQLLLQNKWFTTHFCDGRLPSAFQQQYQQHLQQLQQQQFGYQFDAQPEHIDELVALEMQQLRDHYAQEEQCYVEKMLLENPIVVERRIAPKNSGPIAANAKTTANETLLQRQRAESCRKSRYNNKIKKAKLRFRHKFITNQMTESVNVLHYMRDMIAQAEAQLLTRGYSRTALERLRHCFGVDRYDVSLMTINTTMTAAGTAI